MTRYVTNTNTSTATATSTSTSTNTNTTTNTATKTYGTDADSDGFLQTSEITAAGSDYLFVDQADNQTANFEQDIIGQVFDQQIVLGGTEFMVTDAEGTVIRGDGTEIIYDVTIEQPVFAFDAFNDYADQPISYSVDDGSELPSGIEVISVDADGWFTITQDITQNINQDIVQDVFYETEIIQDFIQTQDINQTYTVNEIRTATATRLVSE